LAHVIVSAPDGSGRLTLSGGAGFAWYPAWSPDGSQLAFSSNRGNVNAGTDIWIVNANGSG